MIFLYNGRFYVWYWCYWKREEEEEEETIEFLIRQIELKNRDVKEIESMIVRWNC